MNPAYNSLVAPAAKTLGQFGIEAGFLIPTKTGMEKSIMDATWPLREYLSRTKFHDYRQQPQGTSSKRVVPIKIVRGTEVIEGRASLYRPDTKEGDPRIWIYDLPKYASAGDLIALIVSAGQLYAINCSRVDLRSQLENPATFLGGLAAGLKSESSVAPELLGKLREIGRKGFVPSLRRGDTGVGFTLETYLGIKANSRKTPDYKGIELKSFRKRGSREITLFSKTPKWTESAFSARAALNTFGYKDKKSGRLQLYCSIDAKRPNSLGFRLDPRYETDHLVNISFSRSRRGEDVFLWLVETLRGAFLAKHHETFWIGAETKTVSGQEQFHYVEATHTRNPLAASFERLLEAGGVRVDLTMSARGSHAVRDHGYLFRLYDEHFEDLFPVVATHSLKP